MAAATSTSRGSFPRPPVRRSRAAHRCSVPTAPRSATSSTSRTPSPPTWRSLTISTLTPSAARRSTPGGSGPTASSRWSPRSPASPAPASSPTPAAPATRPARSTASPSTPRSSATAAAGSPRSGWRRASGGRWSGTAPIPRPVRPSALDAGRPVGRPPLAGDLRLPLDHDPFAIGDLAAIAGPDGETDALAGAGPDPDRLRSGDSGATLAQPRLEARAALAWSALRAPNPEGQMLALHLDGSGDLASGQVGSTDRTGSTAGTGSTADALHPIRDQPQLRVVGER